MTYVFISNNTSAVISISAENSADAWNALNDLVKPEANDFSLEDDEDEDFDLDDEK
jgi:hypothetical protein